MASAFTSNLPLASSRIPIHRYYSESHSDHYYTADYTYPDRGDNPYSYKGIAFYLDETQDESKNSVALYQLYNEYPTYDHYYTTTPSQIHVKEAKILGYCYPEQYKGEDMVPLYRYYESNKNDHFYAITTEGIDEPETDNYEYQGVECYVYTAPGNKMLSEIKGRQRNAIYGGLRQLPQDLDEQLNSRHEDNGDYKFVLMKFNTMKVTMHWTALAFMGLFIFVTMVSVIIFFLCYSRYHNRYFLQREQGEYECLI